MVRQKDYYDYAAEAAGAVGGGTAGFLAPGAIRNRMIRGRIAAGQERDFGLYNTVGNGRGKPRYLAEATGQAYLDGSFDKLSKTEQKNLVNQLRKQQGVGKGDGGVAYAKNESRPRKVFVAPTGRMSRVVDKFDDGKLIKPVGAGKAVRRTKNGVNSYEFEYDPGAYRGQARANIRRGQKSALDMGIADAGAVKNRAMGIYNAGRNKGIGGAWDAFAGKTLSRANQAGKWWGHGSKTNIVGRGLMAGGKPLARLAVSPLSAILGSKLSGRSASAVRDFYN